MLEFFSRNLLNSWEYLVVDNYTKAVLTIIAVSLTVIAMRNAVPDKALAQSGPVHVIVDQVASYALQYAGPIQVRQ